MGKNGAVQFSFGVSNPPPAKQASSGLCRQCFQAIVLLAPGEAGVDLVQFFGQTARDLRLVRTLKWIFPVLFVGLLVWSQRFSYNGEAS
mgnify:CR=1 FL=1